MDFTGKVALITGSSSGIGESTAIKLAKLGANVVINGRNKEKLDKVAKEIAKVSPKKESGVFQIIGDVTKSEDCERLIKNTVDHFGKLDILVNNAGAGAMTNINDPKYMQIYDQMMDLNLKSVVRLTHLALPHLEKSKGVIINMSSVAGLIPQPPFAAYCMAKCGVDMFTRCMAVELGPKGIRVNAVNPAVVRSNFGSALGQPKEIVEKVLEAFAKMYPLRRIGEPIDIANAVAFLASNQSSFITGINLVSDGGAQWLYPQPESLKP